MNWLKRLGFLAVCVGLFLIGRAVGGYEEYHSGYAATQAEREHCDERIANLRTQ